MTDTRSDGLLCGELIIHTQQATHRLLCDGTNVQVLTRSEAILLQISRQMRLEEMHKWKPIDSP